MKKFYIDPEDISTTVNRAVGTIPEGWSRVSTINNKIFKDSPEDFTCGEVVGDVAELTYSVWDTKTVVNANITLYDNAPYGTQCLYIKEMDDELRVVLGDLEEGPCEGNTPMHILVAAGIATGIAIGIAALILL